MVAIVSFFFFCFLSSRSVVAASQSERKQSEEKAETKNTKASVFYGRGSERFLKKKRLQRRHTHYSLSAEYQATRLKLPVYARLRTTPATQVRTYMQIQIHPHPPCTEETF